MIIWIGGAVVHGKGWYGKATGGIIIQDMLTKGSGKHVLRSPNSGCKDHLRCRGSPERRVYSWYWLGEAPGWVRHILLSGHGRSLVSAGFSPCPTPHDSDGPAGSAGRPFSRMGFRCIRRW